MRPLTDWEQRERDGLLSLETPEWRDKRLQAEDPDTTADVLAHLADEVDVAWLGGNTKDDDAGLTLLAEAIVSHPNTPPSILLALFEHRLPFCFRALCRNPVTPLLCLETPAFWEYADDNYKDHFGASGAMMAEVDAPLPLIGAFTQQTNKALAQDARLHVSYAGEIQTQAEGIERLTDFWRAFCVEKSQSGEWQEHYLDLHIKLVQSGLAPVWALGKPIAGLMFAEADKRHKGPHINRNNLVKEIGELFGKQSITPLAAFTVNLYGGFTAGMLFHMGQSWGWMNRLNVALALLLTTKPLPDSEWGSQDPWNRSPLMLMHHLAHDGNRFVRWAAQTRLADPSFVFKWQDEGRKRLP